MKSLKVAAAIAGIFVSSAAFSQSLVKIDGSSTVFPITEAVAEEFQKMKKNAVEVTVGISGTGGGLLCRKRRRNPKMASAMPRAVIARMNQPPDITTMV